MVWDDIGRFFFPQQELINRRNVFGMPSGAYVFYVPKIRNMYIDFACAFMLKSMSEKNVIVTLFLFKLVI